MKTIHFILATALSVLNGSTAFVSVCPQLASSRESTHLFAEGEAVAGPLVSGEELEVILTDLEKPLVIDAYATWSVVVEKKVSLQATRHPIHLTLSFVHFIM